MWKNLALRPSLTVQTNYPDSLGPSALRHTLITREPGGAIINAEPNERRGWSYSDTIHPRTPSADIKEEASGPSAMPPGLLGSQWGCTVSGTWAESFGFWRDTGAVARQALQMMDEGGGGGIGDTLRLIGV